MAPHLPIGTEGAHVGDLRMRMLMRMMMRVYSRMLMVYGPAHASRHRACILYMGMGMHAACHTIRTHVVPDHGLMAGMRVLRRHGLRSRWQACVRVCVYS